MKRWAICAIGMCVAGVTIVRSAPGPGLVIRSVTVTDLGTLGGAESVALDINDTGEIVGWSSTAQGLKRAFLLQGGAMQVVGTVPGGFTAHEAAAINNHMEVVGTGVDRDGLLRGFYTVGGSVIPLPDPPNFLTSWSSGRGISNLGGIAGTIESSRFGRQPGLWRAPRFFAPAPPTLMPTQATFPYDRNEAHDINDSETVVGYSVTAYRGAARWVKGPNGDWDQEQIPSPPPLPAGWGWTEGRALGINVRGTIVGFFNYQQPPSGPWRPRAFSWDGFSGTSRDLGLLPTGENSEARDINEGGFIAGYADTVTTIWFPGGPGRFVRKWGFLWGTWGMFQLPAHPASGGECEAFSLNNREFWTGLIQVVGYCTVGGRPHAMRWDVRVGAPLP